MNETTLDWKNAGLNDWCSVAIAPSKFRLRINHPAKILHTNFDDAASEAAHKIANKWSDKHIYISLSGGLDSEFLAKTLLAQKIPFTPLILKIDDVNAHESWYAEYFCHQRNLKPIILKISKDEYQRHVLPKYLPVVSNTHNPHLPLQLYIIDYVESVGGYFLNGVGDMNLDTTRKEFYCNVIDFVVNIYRDNSHPTGFFMSTPELALSYIWQFNPEINEQYNKLKFYGVDPRPKIDYLDDLLTGERMARILPVIYKNKTITDHHWYGSKQNIIDSLK